MGAKMSETKFSPAPWVLEPTQSGLAVEVFSGDEYICRTRIKDGALIAAAPDLYAALEPLLVRWDDPLSIQEHHWNAARDALKKARGET